MGPVYGIVGDQHPELAAKVIGPVGRGLGDEGGSDEEVVRERIEDLIRSIWNTHER